MIVVDANLLIYAYDRGSAFHADAREWLESTIGGDRVVGIPLLSATAFLRLMTGTLRGRGAMSDAEALAVVNGWLLWPNVRLLVPGQQHWPILNRLLQQHHVTGKLISDAQIATCALEHGASLVTADRHFERFGEILVEYPLGRRQ